MTDFSDMTRGIIESNRYMVLRTADEAGVPWATLGVVRAVRLPAVHLGLVARLKITAEPHRKRLPFRRGSSRPHS